MYLPNKKTINALLLVALVFTLVDGFVHYSFDILALEGYGGNLGYSEDAILVMYVAGKFLGTLIIGYLALLFLSAMRIRNKSLWFTAIIVGILETRYFLSGDYSNQWHLLNLALHSTVLYFTSRYFLKSELN